MDSNMEDYKSQLEAVGRALLTVTSDSDRVSLQGLKENLLELIELTRQTSELGEDEGAFEENTLTTDDQNTKFNYNETKDKPLAKRYETDVMSDLVKLKKQLESMIGQKCSAPHKHSWGSIAYHNAIICGIDNITELSTGSLPDVFLRVLFTNPTHKEMLPCTYLLEGECKFDDTKCHFSHGESVPLNELREYKEPDFEKLVRNCVVLARMKDRIWYKARVLFSNFAEKECRIRLEENKHKEREINLPFENLFPIFHDEDLSSENSSDEGTNTDTEELDNLETGHSSVVEKNIFTFSPSQPLGEWEKHTRGIGSKLMAKMGYIQGTGLGWNGQGIITPISGQVLPQGCSLDYCMQLRECANGAKDLFSIEKKLRRNKKKVDELNARAYEREKRRVDVFSFLNGRIFQNGDDRQNIADVSSKCDKPSLQKQTTKSLNVESVRIADNMRRKKREIAKIEESMRRNAVGTDVYKRLQIQFNSAKKDLETLKHEEISLAKEQATRKTKDKLSIF